MKDKSKKIVKKKSGFLDSGLGSWSDEQVINVHGIVAVKMFALNTSLQIFSSNIYNLS